MACGLWLVAKKELAHRNEAFDIVADVDDNALVHQADNLAIELSSDRVRLADLEPWIVLRLLEAK